MKPASHLGLVGMIFALSLSGCALSSSLRGSNEATEDIKANRLTVRVAGMPHMSDSVYAELLRKRYGIRFENVGGCVISDGQAKELEAYNTLMIPEIKRRFGGDVLSQTEKDAVKMSRH